MCRKSSSFATFGWENKRKIRRKQDRFQGFCDVRKRFLRKLGRKKGALSYNCVFDFVFFLRMRNTVSA